MNRPAPSSPSSSLPPWPGEPAVVAPVRRAMSPLWRVMFLLVVTAIGLSAAFAYFFPAADLGRSAPVVRFIDATEEAGLGFTHRPGGAGAEAPTTLGGAVVVLDFDADGSPDLFFVNSAPWPWEENFSKRAGGTTCALFHNDGHGHFTDVTASAGLNVELQGMAAAVGDFDDDGLPDLFITCVGANHLFHNRGQGRFEDVTDLAGVGGDENTWSTSATWLDFDGDGKLDLVVAHYARWSKEVELSAAFLVAAVGRSYGAPTGFVSAFPSVYRNLGGGRFALVAGSAGLRDVDRQTGLPVAKPLAVVPFDANGDGRLDLLFSYHTAESALFLNRGDGTFRKGIVGRDERREGASAEVATASGLPYSVENGIDERGRLFEQAALLPGKSAGETEVFLPAKLAMVPLDYDLDGHWEIFSGQGRAESDVNKFEAGRDFAAAPQLFWSGGNGWRAAAVGGGAGMESANVFGERAVRARGLAIADFDGDGDLDVVVAQNDGPPVFWRNDQRLGQPWLRVRLIATRTQREAGGARVEVQTPRRTFVQSVAPAMGFMAQSESTLTFGLGEDARVRKIVIWWPSGQRQEVHAPVLNQTLILREP